MNLRRNFDHEAAVVCKTWPVLRLPEGIAGCRFSGRGFTLPATGSGSKYWQVSALKK